MGVQVFTDLLIWQRSREWSKVIFFETQKQPFLGERRLVEQINDSSESVSANIAEGFGRGTQGEFVQFLGYAIGSLNQTQSHLCAAYDRLFLPKETFGNLFAEGTEIRKMIVGFIKSMVMAGSGVKKMIKTPTWSEQGWDMWERLTGEQRPECFRRKGT